MDTIKLKNKDYPFWFSLLAWRDFLAEEKKNNNVDETMRMIYLGLQYGAKKSGDKLDISLNELFEIFDEDLELLKEASGLLGKRLGELSKI